MEKREEEKHEEMPVKRTIEMKNWDDSICISNPDGIEFVTLNYEQLTVYSSFITHTTICARKEDIKIDDKTNDTYIHITYKGQDFHQEIKSEKGE